MVENDMPSTTVEGGRALDNASEGAPTSVPVVVGGQVLVPGPLLMVRYRGGRVTVKTYSSKTALTLALAQAVKPTGRLPVGCVVTAVYADGQQRERVVRKQKGQRDAGLVDVGERVG